MKQKLIYVIASIFFFSLLSCESREEYLSPTGFADDTIKLSTKEVNFNSESNSIIITTEGTFWWIYGIRFDDERFYSDKGDFHYESKDHHLLIKKSDFTIEKKNANEINVSVTENQSVTERILIIYLQAGNHFDAINIRQSGKEK